MLARLCAKEPMHTNLRAFPSPPRSRDQDNGGNGLRRRQQPERERGNVRHGEQLRLRRRPRGGQRRPGGRQQLQRQVRLHLLHQKKLQKLKVSFPLARSHPSAGPLLKQSGAAARGRPRPTSGTLSPPCCLARAARGSAAQHESRGFKFATCLSQLSIFLAGFCI